MSVEFLIPGTPIAKGRPRFARRGNFVRVYNDVKTVTYEGLVAHSASVAMAGRSLIQGPVYVDLDIRLQIPESWSKKKKDAAVQGQIAPTKKPDIDNCEKVIFDGMNGVVWRDDVQVVQVAKRKRYADVPGVVVIVRELDLHVA